MGYKNKILSPSSLLKKIGQFPRSKGNKIAMCHGVFDLVHPGHIRHLSYAKTQADLLIVSITSDIHVHKDSLRPYVPQQLRAENLAALEIVDYVIIDSQPTPLKNIENIKPDFFVKGYEYIDGKVDEKTKVEIQTLKKYGGAFLSTPGDFILSSSKIIKESQPDLSLIKIKSLLEGERLSINKIRTFVDRFKNTPVFVLGDSIIDTYIETDLIGNNAKTPTFSTRYINERKYVGGAAIIAKHLSKAGANVTFCSVLGNDKLGKYIKRDLKKSNILDETIELNHRPTTDKKYFIADNYRLLKVDTVDNSPIPQEIVKRITNKIKKIRKGILIFADFRHGIFNKNSIPNFVKAINSGVFKVADSQVASRWGNILDFKNFDLITPNEKEARFSLADQDTTIRPLASRLYNEARCKNMILKLGEKGTITFRRKMKKNDFRSFFVIDALEKHAVDPVGCGDALLSYAALGLFHSKNIVISSLLGSISAALESKINGNEPITLDEILKKLSSLEVQLNQL